MKQKQHSWSKQEILNLYQSPFLELVYKAAGVHRQYHEPNVVQVSSLLSIKTGGCPEDCGYCPQAARYHTNIESHAMLSLERVKAQALRAKSSGASRICMGAAWRNVKDGPEFDQVLKMVRMLNEMDMEVCCTLGMLTEHQAKRLSNAGLYAYNHNLDTSQEYYKISTRGYEDRLKTLENVRKTNITVCSGGIIGMGETLQDRAGLLLALSQLNPHPESVPINALVPVEGTPMEDQKVVEIWHMVRMIATTRIVMPKSQVRLSAGRTQMSPEGQAWCFMAGANSIFSGDKLLTTPNPDINEDIKLFEALGLKMQKAFAKHPKRPCLEENSQVSSSFKENPRWSRPDHIIARNEQKRVTKLLNPSGDL